MSNRDPINERILSVLEKDGRISNIALAERVGLSPSACLRRVQDLERRGDIAGYRAVIAPQARDVGFVAYVSVGLSRHHATVLRAFEAACAAAPQVRECHNITGTVEYLLRVEVRNLAAYKDFHQQVLGEFAHISAIVTNVVVATSKDMRG